MPQQPSGGSAMGPTTYGKRRTNRSVIRLYLIACGVSLGCCCPPVREQVPTHELQNAWKAIPQQPTALDSATPDTWWEVFCDPKLNAIVEEALLQSPTLAQAVARLEQAEFFAVSTGADQFPQLSLQASGNRRRIPKDLRTSASVPTGNMITPSAPSLTVPDSGVPPIVVPPLTVPSVPEMKAVRTPKFVNDLIANLLVSYELDFWGKYYLATQAALRRAEEAEADLATSRLLLVNDIASTYFTIQAMDEECRLISNEIALHSERIFLLAKQCSSGLTNAFSLLEEQATLETLKTEEQSLIRSRDVNYSLLAVLVGREPNGTPLEVAPASWSCPIVPVGLPSSLLTKRPDVRSRVKEVEAAIAEIGAAKTELLPSISLSAAAGYQAGVAHEWLKWKNRIWSLAASISQSLFDAGQRIADVNAAKARFRQAASSLTNTVLTSVKEVEDALVAIRTQRERRLAAIKREEDIATTTTLYADLYSAGVRDVLSVLQAKEQLIKAKRERVNEEYNLQLGTLSLMKSLGGSWEIEA